MVEGVESISEGEEGDGEVDGRWMHWSVRDVVSGGSGKCESSQLRADAGCSGSALLHEFQFRFMIQLPHQERCVHDQGKLYLKPVKLYNHARYPPGHEGWFRLSTGMHFWRYSLSHDGRCSLKMLEAIVVSCSITMME